MCTSETDHRWYQFSLQSLLLFTAFVAVLCSIGVCTDWSVSAVIAVGGTAGMIVRMSWLGFWQGIVCGGMCAVMGAIGAFLMLGIFTPPIFSVPPWHLTFAMKIGAVIGSLIGGILGGLARYRPGRWRKI